MARPRTRSLTCTARSEERLDQLRDLHARASLPPDLFRYVVTPDPSDADALI